MLEWMPAQTYYDWIVLEQVEPFGEAAHYLRTGIIASTIANVHRGKDSRAFTPEDFMPLTFKAEVKPQDAKSIKARLLAIAEYQNAIVKARGGTVGRHPGH